MGSCKQKRGDCNDSASDGCETNNAVSHDHCGGCGDAFACADDRVCSNGTCAASCTNGETACSGSCVDLDTDPMHCGSCAKACTGIPNGIATCSVATCGLSCNIGYNACGGSCKADSITSCGASCATCTAPANAAAVCSAGTCSFACAPNYVKQGNVVHVRGEDRRLRRLLGKQRQRTSHPPSRDLRSGRLGRLSRVRGEDGWIRRLLGKLQRTYHRPDGDLLVTRWRQPGPMTPCVQAARRPLAPVLVVAIGVVGLGACRDHRSTPAQPLSAGSPDAAAKPLDGEVATGKPVASSTGEAARPHCDAIFNDPLALGLFGAAPKDAKAEHEKYLRSFTHVLAVRIREDSWVDGGDDRLSQHHYKGTVVRSYKGAFRPSENIALVYALDSPAPAKAANADAGKFLFVGTNARTSAEIPIETGHWFECTLPL